MIERTTSDRRQPGFKQINKIVHFDHFPARFVVAPGKLDISAAAVIATRSPTSGAFQIVCFAFGRPVFALLDRAIPAKLSMRDSG